MHRSVVPPALALALAFSSGLAGCLGVPEPLSSAAAEELVPYEASGTLFLPPSGGETRVETLVAVPVNATGAEIAIEMAFGARYSDQESPVSLSDVLVELRDPAGEVLAQGSKTMGTPATINLGATSTLVGDHALVILSYAGSDGNANGEYATYTITVAYDTATPA